MLVLHRSASNCVRIQRVHRRNFSIGQFNFCQTQTTKFFYSNISTVPFQFVPDFVIGDQRHRAQLHNGLQQTTVNFS